MPTSAYLTKMQGIVDELAAAGCTVSTREHVSFILAGLGAPYNALVAALGVVTTPITLSHLYAQLNAYEQRQELLNGSTNTDFDTSANLANRQRRGRFSSRQRGDRADHGDRRERRDDRRQDRRDDRGSAPGRGGGRAPPGGGVVVDEDAAVLHRGSTSSVRYATRRVTRPRLAGGGSKMMMMTLLMIRRLMLPLTG
jgi:hypothetical protein